MDRTVDLEELNDPVMKHAADDFVSIHTYDTVGEALDCIRNCRTESTILYFYVLDAEERLVGTIQTRKLLTSPLNTKIEQIMSKNLIAIPHTANLMEALEFFILHRYLAFPVVDEQRKMLGVIDVNVFTQEMLDIEEQEQVHSVFDTLGVKISEARSKSPWSVFRYRFPWLMATITSGTVCALLVGLFEATLAQSLILAFFLTLVLGLGESVSMQTMAITVHFMHHGLSQAGWYFYSLRRELTRVFLMALACALIVGCIAIIWKNDLAAGIILFSGILASLLLACFLGVSIPTILHKLKLDVHVASGPLTLALADICTIVSYFSLAAFILSK
ncbi:MAG TPA: magnesium transporter [Smithellaceae bacterium]|nr:magnesium transporter [Smithellaceae bacterium]HQG23919.1 magnesium transporter [Smithellaceae bacterium]HQG95116.1 magnesium transporter [Smithellaceae bacterium]HQK28216.1 magnesium transporter [Smithellaceae bacterium]HQM43701.1 magnesium transporter [Smithellaceae bacterium]